MNRRTSIIHATHKHSPAHTTQTHYCHVQTHTHKHTNTQNTYTTHTCTRARIHNHPPTNLPTHPLNLQTNTCSYNPTKHTPTHILHTTSMGFSALFWRQLRQVT